MGESYEFYHVRSYGRAQVRSKTCRKKSAETIVAGYELACEGSNFNP
ncbi:MAG: hypothetical protein LBR36_09975 [Bacteroidales bacterium]|nr:hypothetical protein [Bacteroidales bacterium]